MRSILKGLLAAAALTALASVPAQAAVQVPITVGGGWNTFDFGGVPSAFQDQDGNTIDFTFTLTAPTVLRVTDGFNDGDQFEVAIFDESNPALGLDFVATSPTVDDNNTAFVGDDWSLAFFGANTPFSHVGIDLPIGTYIVSGTVLQSPFFSGEGALELGAVPEPATWTTMLLGFGGLGAMMRRARRAKAATA